MHLHLHIKNSIFNYGLVYAFWCFPFERFNGILGSFQKSVMSPELQMTTKFLTYQHSFLSEVPSSLPPELCEFFEIQVGRHTISEGSIEKSHVDTSSLLDYQKNCTCPLLDIQAAVLPLHRSVSQRYQKFFKHDKVSWLTKVHGVLYPSECIDHVAMIHEQFNEITILGERFLSSRARGNHSATICHVVFNYIARVDSG